MNGETTASKVNRLLQKSRQAFRIYSSMSKSAKAEHNEYADMQAIEWKNINAELIRQLTHIIEKYSTKNLAFQIARMRDLLLSDYRRVEAELNSEHREIIACTQRADFIRVAQLARVLISKKAFVQAAQAASHELSLIIDERPSNQLAQNMNAAVDSEYVNNPRSTAHYSSSQTQSVMDSGQQAENAHQFSSSPFTAEIAAESAEESISDYDIGLFPRMAKVIPLRR